MTTTPDSENQAQSPVPQPPLTPPTPPQAVGPDPAAPAAQAASVPQPGAEQAPQLVGEQAPQPASQASFSQQAPAPAQQPAFSEPTVQQPTIPQPTVPQPAVPYFAASQPTAPQGAYAAPAQPSAHASAGGGLPPRPPVAEAPATAGAHPKSRSGALVAGIAIGALLGGLVGGGTAALVAANLPGQGTATVAAPAGTITLNNTDEVTTVSGVAAIATPSVVTLEVTSSQAAGSGSGVIYTEDGYIVTNNHVATLDGAAGSDAVIRVRLSDGRVLDGTLVGTDPFSDLAIVKVEADDLTPVKIGDSSELNVGDLAIAIGAPLNLPNTVTSGVVSALYRGIAVGTADLPNDKDPSNEDGDSGSTSPWDFRFGSPGEQQQQQQQSQGTTTMVTLPVVQTDASINPGNSGGALLNAKGELIGINVAIASNGGDSSTAGSDGLGFAIPSNLAVRVADAIIAGEQPSHGLLGASVDDSSRDTDEDANRAGALLTDITRGGAADQAGLRAGDVVTSINGIPVDSGTTLSALVRMQEGGSEVTLAYTREGVPGEVTTTLGTLEW